MKQLVFTAGLLFSLFFIQNTNSQISNDVFKNLNFRFIGPEGNRAIAIAGVPGDPMINYIGAASGGLWKTTDGGLNWESVFDDQDVSSIGSIAIAPSNPDIVWAGTGETFVIRPAHAMGDGIYKSEDAGKTWQNMGLEKTGRIGRVVIHPTNPNIVYAAALWVVQSGGPGSKVFKTTDGGKTWKEIDKGLPKLKGKMGIAISPANPKIVYMAIEALGEKGGVYRSDNAGDSFVQTTNDPTTYARAWYYMHIIADPTDEDELWVLNSWAMKSIDGGKTFVGMRGSHVDHHDMWINPDNNNIMINGNDGGGSVTFNGGESWSTLMNQPTGQFYRVIADNQYPYRVYSGQQDNSTIAIDSRVEDSGIGEMHWDIMRAGEYSTVALDPDNPRYVYSTYFASNFVEWDRDIDNTRMVRPYPERVSGEQPKNLKYRANWNGPVIVSPHNPSVIYYGSQYMMKSTDRGVTWQVISEDLTRNNKDHQGKGGFPISNEQITAESYNNLFNIEESPITEGVIWVGSDDGLVHLTKDGGQTWTNVTPKGLKETIINVVEPSPHDPATAYFAAAGYKLNDFTPQIYKTTNYGATWEKIVNGIPNNTFARTVREDPDRKGLLYAGTETGVFVSFNDGRQWLPLQNNLPEVPITDLRVKRKDLVVATQGRSLWILDDLNTIT